MQRAEAAAISARPTTGSVVVAALVAFALAAIPAPGDTRITMREGTEVRAGGEELPEAVRQHYAEQAPKTATYWIAGDRSARLGDHGKMVSRVDRGEAYLVDDAKQRYTVIELGGGDDAGAPNVRTTTPRRTGETRQIGDWQTERWEMTVELAGDATEIVLWVSQGVDVDLAAYHAYIGAYAAQPGFDWLRAFTAIDGFPVRQELSMGPILSWQELVSVSEEAAPPGTYEVPAGYAKSD